MPPSLRTVSGVQRPGGAPAMSSPRRGRPRRRRSREDGGGVGEEAAAVVGDDRQAEPVAVRQLAGDGTNLAGADARDGTGRGRRPAPRAPRSAPTTATRRRAARTRRRRRQRRRRQQVDARCRRSPSPHGRRARRPSTWMTLSSTSPNTSGLASSHECPPRTTWPSVPNVEQNVSNAVSGISRSSSLHSTSTGSSASGEHGHLRTQVGGERGLRGLQHRERVAPQVGQQRALHQPDRGQVVRRAQRVEHRPQAAKPMPGRPSSRYAAANDRGSPTELSRTR